MGLERMGRLGRGGEEEGVPGLSAVASAPRGRHAFSLILAVTP